MKIKILFVCLGNICRSPAAEGIFKSYIKGKDVEHLFEIDSAGLSGYHEGELPDQRMRAHASRRGYDLTSYSRPVRYDDFEYFDLIVGMDESNRSGLKDLAPTQQAAERIYLMTDFCPDCIMDHIPDPYYGGADGFELVIDLIEQCCEPLLNFALQNH